MDKKQAGVLLIVMVFILSVSLGVNIDRDRQNNNSIFKIQMEINTEVLNLNKEQVKANKIFLEEIKRIEIKITKNKNR